MDMDVFNRKTRQWGNQEIIPVKKKDVEAIIGTKEYYEMGAGHFMCKKTLTAQQKSALEAIL